MSTTIKETDKRAFVLQDHPWCQDTSTAWIKALMKRVRQKYEQQVYWIKSDYDGSDTYGKRTDLPDTSTMICKGWLHIYARPGNNEAHVVIMEWERHKHRPTDPHVVHHLLMIKDDRGLEHALEIVAWLTQAVYQ